MNSANFLILIFPFFVCCDFLTFLSGPKYFFVLFVENYFLHIRESSKICSKSKIDPF